MANTQPGTVLDGRFELKGELGRGGAGVLWEAHDRVEDIAVAVKILHPRLRTSPRARERFRREAELLRSLDHPNIARAHAVELDRALPFFAMELVHGPTLEETLRERCADGAFLPLDDAERIVARLGAAIQHAHEQGVIHRDLKPANVIVGSDGEPKLLDFGIARLLAFADQHDETTVGRLVGTYAYMSPEQIRGTRTGVASDQFSFAVLVHELLNLRRMWVVDRTGECAALDASGVPHTRNTPQLLAERITSGRRPLVSDRRPELSDLDAVFERALAVDEVDRFESVAAFTERVVSSIATAQPTLLQPTQALPPVEETTVLPPAPSSRKRDLWLAAIGIVVAIAAGIVMTPTRSSMPPTETKPAKMTSSPTVTPKPADEEIEPERISSPEPKRRRPERVVRRPPEEAAKSNVADLDAMLARLRSRPDDLEGVRRLSRAIDRRANETTDAKKAARARRLVRSSEGVADLDGLASAIRVLEE